MIIFILIILLPKVISSQKTKRLIVWNVGQGQWSTILEPHQCLHFDMGGESSHLKGLRAAAKKLCHRKENVLFISHWDQDHYNFVSRLKWIGLFRNCLGPSYPLEPHVQQLKPILPPPCAKKHEISYQLLFSSQADPSKMKTNMQNRNHFSWVFSYGKEVLLPGDSTKEMEKIWTKNINADFRHLILGHHGSRTSTSEFLLQSLPQLRQALVSARKAKYGHPHIEVSHRLQKKGIAMIRTEDWGNIEIELRSNSWTL